MKNVFLLICCFITFSCQEGPKKESSEKSENSNTQKTIDALSSIEGRLCFLTTLGNTKIQGKTVQDSLVLHLRIAGTEVTGTYDWIPAEKDMRKGSISAKKEGSSITGEYVFMQEGRKQTQPIHIELHENFAKVTTNSELQGEMVVKIEKVVCK